MIVVVVEVLVVWLYLLCGVYYYVVCDDFVEGSGDYFD